MMKMCKNETEKRMRSMFRLEKIEVGEKRVSVFEKKRRKKGERDE